MADLYADGARGVYIPQHFAESVHRQYVKNVSDDDWRILELGPTVENESYWDAWNDVTSNAVIEAPDGRKGFLWQDGDLWIVWGEDDPDHDAILGLDYSDIIEREGNIKFKESE